MQFKFRHFLLGRWSHLIGRNPRMVIACATALAAICIIFTAVKLEFQPDRNDLLSRSLPWNQTFINWQQNFPGKDDLIVIADFASSEANHESDIVRPSPNHAQAQRALFAKLAQTIEQLPSAGRVEWRHAQSDFHPKAIRLLPWPRFEKQLEEIAQSKTLLQSASAAAFIGSITRQLRENETGAPAGNVMAGIQQYARALEQIQQLDHIIESMQQRLIASDDEQGAKLEALMNQTEPYQLLTPDERFHFMRVTPRKDEGSLNEYATAITSLRSAIDAHREEAAALGMSLGLTGIPVIEMDETQVATLDSTYASIVSVVLILILLMVAFYSVRTPLLAIASLLIGIAWTFGYVTLVVGHLQVISVVFTVMLLSLGVAYGIHITARFELMRHARAAGRGGFMGTMRDTLETVGPGLFTGAITTAAAFATTLLTDFKGVAEMGNIAAVGIGLCLLAMLSVFPAMLGIFRSEHRHIKPMELREFHFFKEHWVLPFARRPKRIIAVALLITLASGCAITQMRFDFDLLKLFPRGVESVDWQTRLSQAGRPIYFGASVCKDIEAARVMADSMRQHETVAKTFGGIGILFPEEEARKIEALTAVRAQLIASSTVIETAGNSPDLYTTLQTLQLAMNLAAARQMPEPIRIAITKLTTTTKQTVNALAAMEPPARQARLARLEEEYLAWRGQSARMILATLDVSPLTPADLPADLLSPYIAKDGQVVLEVYPNLPDGIESILSPLFLPRYVKDMEASDPNITGPSPQIYRSGLLIKESYQFAGLLALLVVFVLVYLDFRRLIDALLTLIPVTIGFAATFGIMWCLGIQINPANIIVLPLMFGIGVDAGVHMIHRFRHSPDAQPLGLAAGTGKGITITNLATVLGFATLIFARHRGVSSLGFVLTTGIALTTLACWFVMPAVLGMVRKWEMRNEKKLRVQSSKF